MKKKKRKKYATGTSIKNYMENPYTELMQGQMDMAQAQQEAASNPWTIGLKAAGNMAMQYGLNMENSDGSKGFGSSKGGQAANSLLPMLANMKFGFGGNIPNIPVEVEGEEVGEMPNGKLLDFKGPSHDNGGIDVSLPEGTEMYSKRIKIDGVSMADRKKKRKKKEVTLEELMEKNSTDKLLKNSLSRTKKNNKKQDGVDKNIQETVKSLLEPQQTQEHKWGDTVLPIDTTGMMKGLDMSIFDNIQDIPELATNPYVGDFKTPNILDKLFGGKGQEGGATIGDGIGMIGDVISTFGPMNNTLKNRAGDTPNINAFENFGEDGLNTLDESKQYVSQQRDENLKDLQLSRTGAIKRGRNSARGINTMRGLDLATDMGVNNQQSKIYSAAAQQMMQILGQEAQMENQQDNGVMQGEQNRDIADRQDRDNFFTQMGKDITSKGKGIQTIGGRFNQLKQNKDNLEMIDQMKQLGYEDNDIKLFLNMMNNLPGVAKPTTKKSK